ncbi:DUF6461 domain-containing protein [Streptomyces griseoluteus]
MVTRPPSSGGRRSSPASSHRAGRQRHPTGAVPDENGVLVHLLCCAYSLRLRTPEGEHDECAPVVDGKAAVLALAERLTGVRVTESLLQDATYQLGLVPEQPAEKWTGLVIDIADAHGERLYKEWTYEEIAAASDRARAEANAPAVITYNEPLAKGRSEHETGEERTGA